MIAVTGGVAEGKSTVLGYMAELGLRVDSADRIAREAYNDEDVQIEIARVFDIPRGDRDGLRSAILVQPELRRELNRLMHPYILNRIRETIADAIEVPLLLEACLQGEFSEIWVVTCGPEAQLRRLIDRLRDEEAARSLIATQLPSRAKVPFADVVVRTNADEANVKRLVTEALTKP